MGEGSEDTHPVPRGQQGERGAVGGVPRSERRRQLVAHPGVQLLQPGALC